MTRLTGTEDVLPHARPQLSDDAGLLGRLPLLLQLGLEARLAHRLRQGERVDVHRVVVHDLRHRADGDVGPFAGDRVDLGPHGLAGGLAARLVVVVGVGQDRDAQIGARRGGVDVRQRRQVGEVDRRGVIDGLGGARCVELTTRGLPGDPEGDDVSLGSCRFSEVVGRW